MVQNGVEPIAYSWNDPTNQTSQTAVGLNGAQQYTCIVTDAIGCRLSRSVYVEPTKGCLFVATVITPNGDGANDTWVLGGMEFFPSAKIQVFNRWGQVVFESTGYSSPWNGTYQGQLLPVADYYFIIDYSSDKEPITGTVTIKY
jgi:gliding motility-associated-like protein